MGVQGPERDTDEHIVFSEPRKGVYKSLVIRDEKLIGATMLGDTSKVAFLMQAFDRGLPLPEERLEMLFNLGTPAAEVGVAELADDAQVCNCNGVSKGALVRLRGERRQDGRRRDGQDPGRQGLRLLQDHGLPDRRMGGRRRRRRGPVRELVRARHPDGQAGADDGDPGAGAASRCPRCSRRWRRTAPRTPSRKMGLASLLKMMWADEYIDEKDARFINDRVHANIQKDGTFSVVPQMKGGVTTPAQLRRIADVAEKWDVPMVKLTGGQRIDLLGITKEDLPGVWADLGMPSGYAYGKSFRTVKTCVGSDFCRFGVGDSTALGIKIESRFQGLESPGQDQDGGHRLPAQLRRGATCKDVGVVAIDGGRWEIYVGGAAGAHIRKGDLLATVDDPDVVDHAHRPVHAVLPGERQVAGAHLRVRAAGRASISSAR